MKNTQLLNIQNTVEETVNNSNSTREDGEPLVIHEQLETTPFWIHLEDTQWYATYGKFKITDNFTHKDKLIDHLYSDQYNIICKMILCTIEQTKEKA